MGLNNNPSQPAYLIPGLPSALGNSKIVSTDTAGNLAVITPGTGVASALANAVNGNSGLITYAAITPTIGSVPFITTGGALTQNNSNLFWDNTNFYLGVGVASPIYPFDLAGTGGRARFSSSSNATSAFLVLSNVTNSAYVAVDNNSGTDFGAPNAGAFSSTFLYPFVFITNALERMRVTTDGNLAVGSQSTINSYTRLQLARAGYCQAVITNTSAAVQAEIAVYDASFPFSIGTLTNHDMYFNTNNTERLRIKANGDIYGTAGSTGMTAGFPYMPSAAGAPSGTPTSYSGRVAFYYDTTNDQFYVYNGGWKKVTLA